MSRRQYITLLSLSCLVLSSLAMAAEGSGEFKATYLYLDEEGNQSVNHGTFNVYDGPGISLENFRYAFDNGLLLRANLRNIILNNRNLSVGLSKAGLFRLEVSHDQYRRFYSFDGTSFTRRHQTGGLLSFRPHRYLELFGGGQYVAKSGSMVDLFEPTTIRPSQEVDFNQTFFKGGLRLLYQGRMLQAEYQGNQFKDKLNSDRDQTRSEIRLTGVSSVPRFERLLLSGGFRHFETEFDVNDFAISNNRGWGNALLELPENFTIGYSLVLDRTSSDSDLVATDNLVNAFYVGKTWPGVASIVIGYQNDINDDFEDEVKANCYYLSAWGKPLPELELRVEHGIRAEEVTDGARLVGDEDRARFKASVKYRRSERGTLMLKLENSVRKNDQIGSKSDLVRVVLDGQLTLCRYATLQGGYSIGTGKYENSEQTFEFTDHTFYGDVTTSECRQLTAGAGATYYRSRRDLDVESFNLHFMAGYRFFDDLRLEAKYNVHNFDDFLVTRPYNQYYTANIVEVNLVKGLSF